MISPDSGSTWGFGIPVTGQSSKLAPALCAIGSTEVAMAYVANDSSNDLYFTSSGDGGNTWTPGARIPGQSSKHAPALCTIGSTLLLAYVANNSTSDLLVTTSVDGG